MHVTGERKSILCSIIFTLKIFLIYLELSQITGVAAILRFPMPELEDDEEEEDDDSVEYTPLPPS